MKDLVLIVDDVIASLDYKVLAELCEFLGVSALAIFKISSVTEFSMLINLYKPSNMIMSSIKVLDDLYPKTSPIALSGQIHSVSLMGKQINMLITTGKVHTDSLKAFKEVL